MRKHKVLVTTFAALFALGVIGVAQAWAQNGVISFRDACNDRAYVMRGEAESASNPRVLVPLPSPARGSWGRVPLDTSTSGPVTVLLFGLFAVQVNDIGGNLVPDAPENIRFSAEAIANAHLPASINEALGKFSPTGDRVALVTQRDFTGDRGGVLVVADIVRDVNLRITGLTNPTVKDLFDIGSPSDSNITSDPFMGYPDFSPDGTQIVVTVYSDLWLLTLNGDRHTLASSQPLTRTVDDTESEAAFSPNGNMLAYTAGPNRRFPGGALVGPEIRSLNLFTLDLATLGVTQVTTRKNSPAGIRSAAWSPDGTVLAFMAEGERAPRGSPCNGVVNYDIFSIKADGTGMLGLLTNTVGNGAEYWSQWGW